MNFALEQFMNSILLYAVVVLVPYYFFCHSPIKYFAKFRTELFTKKKPDAHEIKATLTSFLVLFGCLLLLGLVKPLRTDLPLWWKILSITVIIFAHDAYFYWTHYLMHKSKFFYRFHKEHHLSSEATPLDVLAFHPVEAFIHFIFFAVYPMIIPSSLETMQFMFVWMLVCNSAGHMPYEFYPKFLYDFPILRECNAATHHLMHHKYYTSNFSIYYNWWDRWMGTNHKDYFSMFKAVKSVQTSKVAINEKSSEPVILYQVKVQSNGLSIPGQVLDRELVLDEK